MIELSNKSSSLNSTTIYPKCDHTLYSVLITENKMALWISPLPWAHFVFLFLLFQGPELDHHHHMSTPPPWTSFHVAISIHKCHLAPSLGLDQPVPNPHLEYRVSPNRFHQLTKTKLGLSRVLIVVVSTWDYLFFVVSLSLKLFFRFWSRSTNWLHSEVKEVLGQLHLSIRKWGNS